jgi:hypothetical protein
MLAGLRSHWVSATQARMVSVCLLALVGPLQLISCLIAMLARDTMPRLAWGC